MSSADLSIPVALKGVGSYDRKLLDAVMDEMISTLPLPDVSGASVLLKPNLVSASALACSQPAMVAAAARWFVDHGSRVSIGDSPAFGGGRKVMEKCGIAAAVSGLPVDIVDFDRGRMMNLAHGGRVMVAAAPCLLYIPPSPRDRQTLRMSSSARQNKIPVQRFFPPP